MSLKSRYRLMRMRSRVGDGRLRRAMLVLLLVVAAAFVMLLGLVVLVVLLWAAAVFLAVLYMWSLVSRLGRARRRGGEDQRDDGVTLEGEYTVEDKDSNTRKRDR